MTYQQFNMKFSKVIGAKVRCIRDDFEGIKDGPPEKMPEVGETYTVRQVVPMFGGEYYRFEEIKNPEWQTEIGPFEPAYTAKKFELVDISDIT